MSDTYTYRIGDNLYLNLTNRCTNRCTFCVREGKETYEGYALWLKEGEPSAEKVLSEIGDPRAYKEIVFCGFGEPTCRLREMLSVAEEVKRRGGSTRLNTNGHGSLYNGKDIAPLLKGKIDAVNVSMNAPDAASYVRLCRPSAGEEAFSAMLDFAVRCREEGITVWFSVVDCIGKEAVAACKKLAEERNIPLRVREMIE